MDLVMLNLTHVTRTTPELASTGVASLEWTLYQISLGALFGPLNILRFFAYACWDSCSAAVATSLLASQFSKLPHHTSPTTISHDGFNVPQPHYTVDFQWLPELEFMSRQHRPRIRDHDHGH
ncbi:hypothetical protein TNCV_1424861 [Trichonephila clavipes]|nr:hypothetical protein TNCV_1424861 [Trichonephila clavipes]